MTPLTLILPTMCALLMQGCYSCDRLLAKNPKDADQQDQASQPIKFGLSPEALFVVAADFSYQSSLQLSLFKQDRQATNNEIVTIQGVEGRIHLSKKIDGSHFFEIMSDQHQFFVKSRTGNWRSGNSNKAHYKSLIADSFNLLPWLNEQFKLESLLTQQGRAWVINNVPIPADAPFVALIKDPLTSSNISAHISLDPATSFPLSATVAITLESGPEFHIKLQADMSLTKNSNLAALRLPEIKEDEPLLFPVNIATRFKNLMDQEHSK